MKYKKSPNVKFKKKGTKNKRKETKTKTDNIKTLHQANTPSPKRKDKLKENIKHKLDQQQIHYFLKRSKTKLRYRSSNF